ncbi:vascular cell adhesion protein 1-like [Liolophura sinensis]|uniref:vascular cell adhesion protein 1-like n=1 Tax=Liolophura sinensis TaxID=3198878 RepID=UPI003158B77F
MTSRGPRTVGSTLTIDCLVRAPSTATITLSKNSRTLQNTERVSLTQMEGTNGGVHYLITITSLVPSDSGLYTCEGSNGGSVSRSSTGISIRGSSQSVGLRMTSRGPRTVGSTLTIDCLVRAPSTATITLSKNSRTLQNTDRVSLTQMEGTNGGVHYLITITSLVPSDSGLYTCEVRNGGSVSRSSTGISIGGGRVLSSSSSSWSSSFRRRLRDMLRNRFRGLFP